MTWHNIIILSLMMTFINSDRKSSSKNVALVSPDPELLLEMQRHLIEYLENFITKNSTRVPKRKLVFLLSKLNQNKAEYLMARRNSERYFDNAINRVIVIKTLTTDLDEIVKLGIGWQRNNSLRYPSYKDLKFSVGALADLQRFYHLNVTQLAGGRLNTSFNSSLTASDCYVIGKVMFKSNLHTQGMIWLLEAFHFYRKANPDTEKIVQIVIAICKGYDVLGDHENYLLWTKELILLNPRYKKDLQTKIDLHTNLQQRFSMNRDKEIQKGQRKRIISIDPKYVIESCSKAKESKAFGMLCRGEIGVNPKVFRKLSCWYSAGQHPFSYLARFQTEQLFIEPDLLLVHNMLNDHEINNITQFASSRYIIKTEILREKFIVYPFIKTTNLDSMTSETKDIITKRVSHFTGLKADHSQWLVSKYAVGGYYHLHSDSKAYNPYDSNVLRYYNLTCPLQHYEDFRLNQIFEDSKKICRIGTILIYLSDVEQGGATVFPVLGVVVNPVKGSALFWRNLMPSGDIDDALCHGACPVLHGCKTVITSQWYEPESRSLCAANNGTPFTYST